MDAIDRIGCFGAVVAHRLGLDAQLHAVADDRFPGVDAEVGAAQRGGGGKTGGAAERRQRVAPERIEGDGERDFAADANTRPAKFYRIANEVPTLLMIGIVILVVVKPF